MISIVSYSFVSANSGNSCTELDIPMVLGGGSYPIDAEVAFARIRMFCLTNKLIWLVRRVI